MRGKPIRINGKSLYQISKETGIGTSTLSGRIKRNPNISYQELTRPQNHYKKTHPTLYNAYKSMKQRCLNANYEKKHRYANRGITICQEWAENIESFCKWALANGYKERLMLDRINNDGNYCPENCRWVTQKEQQRNKSTNLHLNVNGEAKCVAEWAEILNIKPCRIYNWVYRQGIEFATQQLEISLMPEHVFTYNERKTLVIDGIAKSYAEWARNIGVHRSTISGWIKRGEDYTTCKIKQLLINKHE